MAEEFREKHLTDGEVQAMIALWAQRREVLAAGPTVADVAEALEISLAEAEALALEIIRQKPSVPHPMPSVTSHAGIFCGRLALASVALTGFFCTYLNTLLA